MATSSDGPAQGKRSTAFIGDLSGSRDLAPERRQQVQEQLSGLVEGLNSDFDEALLSLFTITLGDEFQGLLSDPAVIPEVLWRLRRDLSSVEIWTGVGFGALDTALKDQAIGMDGPVFHRAREGLDRAREQGIHGGVFVGFGDDDAVLTGLARLLDHQRSSFSPAQLEAMEGVRSGHNQSGIAAEVGVTPQAISKRLRTAGWDVYRMGEEALRLLLDRYATTEEWNR